MQIQKNKTQKRSYHFTKEKTQRISIMIGLVSHDFNDYETTKRKKLFLDKE